MASVPKSVAQSVPASVPPALPVYNAPYRTANGPEPDQESVLGITLPDGSDAPEVNPAEKYADVPADTFENPDVGGNPGIGPMPGVLWKQTAQNAAGAYTSENDAGIAPRPATPPAPKFVTWLKSFVRGTAQAQDTDGAGHSISGTSPDGPVALVTYTPPANIGYAPVQTAPGNVIANQTLANQLPQNFTGNQSGYGPYLGNRSNFVGVGVGAEGGAYYTPDPPPPGQTPYQAVVNNEAVWG